MTNAQRETLECLCDGAMVIPFAAVVPLCWLLLGIWAFGNYLLGPLLLTVGIG
jgi:hypothetical protein